MTMPLMIEIPAVELTEEQSLAVQGVINALDFTATSKWFRNRKCVALAGPAGSGKTTLIHALLDAIPDVYNTDKGIMERGYVLAAFTHKAARVLHKKGLHAVTSHAATSIPLFKPPYDALATYFDGLHLGSELERPTCLDPLIEEYTLPRFNKACERAKSGGILAGFFELGIKWSDYFMGWGDRPEKPGRTLIIDEASMVGRADLERACRVYDRVVLVGDENQLPPVKQEAVFWEVEPRFVLETIHRQAEGSQPLQIAKKILNDERIERRVQGIDAELSKIAPVIVWTNKARIVLTREIRETLGMYGALPIPGESIICKKHPDTRMKSLGFVNNSTWLVVSYDANGFVLADEDGVEQPIRCLHMEEYGGAPQGLPFVFSYVITGHSAQGSEWKGVQVHVPSVNAYYNANRKEAKQWLYTAATRAREKVFWVNNDVG